MSQEKKSSNKIVKVLGYLLTVFVFQELVLRICFPLPEISNFDRINYLKLTPDSGGNTFARDQSWYWQSQPDTAYIFEHFMNRNGFRDTEWKVRKEAGTKRALFIGDSFVEGVMADQKQTIPNGFENAARAEHFETMNAGMLGMGLSSYLQLLADITPIYKPDVVFLCVYANDLGQTVPLVPQVYLEPEYFSAMQPRLLEVLSEWDKHGAVPFRWSGSSKPYLPAKGETASLWTDNEEMLTPHVTPVLAEAMKKGELNTTRINAFMEEERHLKLEPKTGETVPFLKYFCDKFGAEAVLVYIPTRNQVTKHYYPFEKQVCQVEYRESMDLTTPAYQIHQEFLAKQCAEFGVHFIDLTPSIKAKEDAGTHLYWNYDDHMRGSAYLWLGETVYAFYQKLKSDNAGTQL